MNIVTKHKSAIGDHTMSIECDDGEIVGLALEIKVSLDDEHSGELKEIPRFGRDVRLIAWYHCYCHDDCNASSADRPHRVDEDGPFGSGRVDFDTGFLLLPRPDVGDVFYVVPPKTDPATRAGCARMSQHIINPKYTVLHFGLVLPSTMKLVGAHNRQYIVFDLKDIGPKIDTALMRSAEPALNTLVDDNEQDASTIDSLVRVPSVNDTVPGDVASAVAYINPAVVACIDQNGVFTRLHLKDGQIVTVRSTPDEVAAALRKVNKAEQPAVGDPSDQPLRPHLV